MYWPQYAGRFEHGDLDDVMHWHALPEGWEELDYKSFLVARRPLMAGVIREGFETLGSGLG